MPQKKKHPSTRARANRAATAATLKVREVVDYSQWSMTDLRAEIDRRNEERETPLPKPRGVDKLAEILAADDFAGPALPERAEGWHPLTQEMWDDIWASPMSDEWDDSDIHNVYILAAIFDDIWRGETAKERKDAAAEYRLQRVDLGLSPYSRRRLEWTIESAEEAKDRGKQRRSRVPTPGAASPAPGTVDPRQALRAVK